LSKKIRGKYGLKPWKKVKKISKNSSHVEKRKLRRKVWENFSLSAVEMGW